MTGASARSIPRAPPRLCTARAAHSLGMIKPDSAGKMGSRVSMLADVSPAERTNLFIKKLRLCSCIFDFSEVRSPFGRTCIRAHLPRLSCGRPAQQSCNGICDAWTQGSGQDKEKDVKRQTLLELVDYVNNCKNTFPEQVLPELVNMVRSRCFASLSDARFPANKSETLSSGVRSALCAL